MTATSTAKIYDLSVYYLKRYPPRGEIDIAALRARMTPAMRRVARRIEDLVLTQGLPLGTAVWRAWDRHPRLKMRQIIAARDLAGWRLSEQTLTRRRAGV